MLKTIRSTITLVTSAATLEKEKFGEDDAALKPGGTSAEVLRSSAIAMWSSAIALRASAIALRASATMLIPNFQPKFNLL